MAPETVSAPDLPESVGAKVRAAHRMQFLLVAAESSIVGLSAGVAALAAGTAARADPNDPQTVAILVLVSILAAVSWWLERRAGVASIARALDRRAGLRGALFTAFEADSTASRSEVAAVLVRRVAPAVSARRFLESEARTSAAVLAAPFLAVALLGAVSEGRTSADGPRALARNGAAGRRTALERLEQLRAEARRLASSPDVLAEDAAELGALVERVAAIRSRAADPGASLADLERESAEISRRIGELARPETGPGVASGGPEGTMVGPDARIDRPTDGPMREPAPPNPPESASTDVHPVSPRVEGGVGASRWWPEHYDGVVERWIEARRSASGGRPR